MGVKFLHELVESGKVTNSVVPVDLIKLAKTYIKSLPAQSRKPGAPKLCLVIDGECCLNRLYGGYFSGTWCLLLVEYKMLNSDRVCFVDWVCGGQWNRMVNFLEKLIGLLENSNVELIVFFNGAIETQRMNEWIMQQKEESKKVNQVSAKNTDV